MMLPKWGYTKDNTFMQSNVVQPETKCYTRMWLSWKQNVALKCDNPFKIL